ncbi:TPA: carbohydrate ABC transporter substrate-binding protein [Clostridium botulinum]|uniref:ABC transporter substrate-binding protein n=1 Tax=Clostridium botulinum TaxID=1491 RepID=UPI00041B5A2F|nr:ABC transporter substrate-binding protein [Clostridium botulinum]MBO0525992.1 carbohydrate ABC transporter substrate-binding protein [Clostridium botulinum]MBO0530648.1 carbohydrate ABC transporter substrate-binding protein [Clostridium botulinum]MBO0536401.1 carbohydrate ABC transporter substrate-binding protein [Clostridium botulinum]MBO0537238.1 carbohydrate ABC transporter substrate-binding protein [Clostridium botulinum]MBO0543734.1 carbohydrate ABC transporter substrate-binding protei
MKFKKIICFILILILPITFVSCKKENKTNNKELNMYIDIKDENSLSILKIIMEEYKKSNEDVKININNALGSNVEEELKKEKSPDLIFVSRNEMIKLSQKGLLDNMETSYEKNNITKDYYNVFNSYGRFKDKYYGLPIIPYTIEVLYNTEALNKLKIEEPKNINDIKNVMKKLKTSSTKVPVMLTNDLDINSVMFSIISNNITNSMELENIYNKEKKEYQNLKNMQEPFNIINNMVKDNTLDENSFEEGKEVTLEKFNNGDIPIIISTSYYNNQIKNPNIKSVKQLYNVDKLNNTEPVIINSIMCLPLKAKNSEEANNFIDFTFSEKTQKYLLKKGFVTGNKKINKEKEGELTKLNKTTVEKLSNLNENSILILYNLPNTFKSSISASIDKILNNEYTGKEWNKIVEDNLK